MGSSFPLRNLCVLCVSVEFLSTHIHRRDAEHAEVAQRESKPD